MGTKSCTDVFFKYLNNSEIEIISILTNYGWTFNENGEIWFLPLHDNDMFYWQKRSISTWDEVRSEIVEKSKLKEIIGIDLVWKDTMIGGQFHFNIAPDLLSINWNINRKSHQLDQNKSDIDWYEPKIIQPLLKAGVQLKLVSSEDTDSGGTILAATSYYEASLHKQFGVE